MTKPIIDLDIEDEITTLKCDCGPAQLLDGICQNCGMDYNLEQCFDYCLNPEDCGSPLCTGPTYN